MIESRGVNGMFGEERLLKLASHLQNEKPEELIQIIFENISEFSQGRLEDDLAILALVLT